MDLCHLTDADEEMELILLDGVLVLSQLPEVLPDSHVPTERRLEDIKSEPIHLRPRRSSRQERERLGLISFRKRLYGGYQTYRTRLINRLISVDSGGVGNAARCAARTRT